MSVNHTKNTGNCPLKKSLPFPAAEHIFSLRSMKMTFHCSGWKMDLHLDLTLKIWPVWRIQLWSVRFIHSFELLNWTLSWRWVEIGLSVSVQGYRHCPRAKCCSLNQIKYKLQTGSYALLVITIGLFFWDSNRTTESKIKFYRSTSKI